MFVAGKFLVQGLEEHLVGDLADVEAGLVENSEDALVWSLHQITDHLVVEVVHLEHTRTLGFMPIN